MLFGEAVLDVAEIDGFQIGGGQDDFGFAGVRVVRKRALFVFRLRLAGDDKVVFQQAVHFVLRGAVVFDDGYIGGDGVFACA